MPAALVTGLRAPGQPLAGAHGVPPPAGGHRWYAGGGGRQAAQPQQAAAAAAVDAKYCRHQQQHYRGVWCPVQDVEGTS